LCRKQESYLQIEVWHHAGGVHRLLLRLGWRNHAVAALAGAVVVREQLLLLLLLVVVLLLLVLMVVLLLLLVVLVLMLVLIRQHAVLVKLASVHRLQVWVHVGRGMQRWVHARVMHRHLLHHIGVGSNLENGNTSAWNSIE
jgi:hypothetical protein